MRRAACSMTLPPTGNQRGAAEALRMLGLLVYHEDDATVWRDFWNRSLALSREIGDKRGVANILRLQADEACAAGNYEAGRILYQESIALFREVGDRERL